MYPSVDCDTYCVALTQPGPNNEEHPIAFVARYLTSMQVKYTILTTLVSVAACAVRKLNCYTAYAVIIRVVLPMAVEI